MSLKGIWSALWGSSSEDTLPAAPAPAVSPEPGLSTAPLVGRDIRTALEQFLQSAVGVTLTTYADQLKGKPFHIGHIDTLVKAIQHTIKHATDPVAVQDALHGSAALVQAACLMIDLKARQGHIEILSKNLEGDRRLDQRQIRRPISPEKSKQELWRVNAAYLEVIPRHLSLSQATPSAPWPQP